MESKEYDIIIDKIKKILQNKPLGSHDVIPHSQEVDRVQEALVYLSSSLIELNEFATILCRGELDGPQPDRHNYFAGGLKELHAVLKHLTWQTKQVAEGDYRQRINFLGDFSLAFNQMVEQLDERERMLMENMRTIEQSIKLLTSVMDEHKDWILVENLENHRIVYNNRMEEKIEFYSVEELGIKEVPMEMRDGTIAPLDTRIYHSNTKNHYYSIRTYPLTWEGADVLIHYISDITQEQAVQKDLSNKAYMDQLTGVYNRHYCMMELDRLLQCQEPFSLVMVDLNNLKYVNDTFGHDEGDAYINHAVGHMCGSTRESDAVCRLGGDEFILLLMNCEEGVAHRKMKQIFDAIHTEHEKGYMRSISYGITTVDYNDTYTRDSLIRESDAKMYEFKLQYKQTKRG